MEANHSVWRGLKWLKITSGQGLVATHFRGLTGKNLISAVILIGQVFIFILSWSNRIVSLLKQDND